MLVGFGRFFTFRKSFLEMFRRSFSRWVSAADIEGKIKAAAALSPLTALTVSDISGGCGSFFKVEVTSAAFDGKTLINQHRLVHEVLKEEIKQIHGITVVSKVPPK